jgi:hypothetical protein
VSGDLIPLVVTAQYDGGEVWLRLNGAIAANVPAVRTPDAGPGSEAEVVVETVMELLTVIVESVQNGGG